MPNRINFTPKVRAEIAKRAMHFCSNPACLRFTAYKSEKGKARTIAEAAHVIPASPGGPRCKPGQEESYIKSPENGVWLCRICHDIVDENPGFYSADLLQEWKEKHEQLMRRIVGKDLELVILELRNSRRYHEEVKQLLSFFDDRRVLYASMDNENATFAFESAQIIRQKLVDLRSRIAPDSLLWECCEKIQRATQSFLDALGPNVDWRKVYCGCPDHWPTFVEAVNIYRAHIKIYLQTLASNCDYKFVNMFIH